MDKLKGIILDVDGVIIGKKEGINFPNPSEEVINKLKEINANGTNIHLCTSKPFFAINKLVKKIGLNTFHISNGGAIISNPINKKIISKHVINKKLAKKVIEFCMKNSIYIEAYTKDEYYICRNKICDITKKRAEKVMMQEAIVVDDLNEIIDKDIVQFKFISTEQNKENINKLFLDEKIELSINWTFHPAIPFLKTGDVTSKDISKRQGLLDICEYLNVSTGNILGVGDSKNDWNFIQLCKYKCAMGNASEELKKLVLAENGYIGESVDDNGIIDILDYFLDRLNL